MRWYESAAMIYCYHCRAVRHGPTMIGETTTDLPHASVPLKGKPEVPGRWAPGKSSGQWRLEVKAANVASLPPNLRTKPASSSEPSRLIPEAIEDIYVLCQYVILTKKP